MIVRLDPPASGPANMAADVALLEAAEEGELGARVYSWDGPWLSLGRFQRPADVLSEMGDLPWVMRPTGGKAVRHGEDLTVAIAAPLAMLRLGPRDVKAAYRALAAPLVAGLSAIGANAELAENTEWCGNGTRTADCFAYASPNDIVDAETGQKVCGCALRLTERAVLVQASIPLEARTFRSEVSTKMRDSLAASLRKLHQPDSVAVGIGHGR